jgi:hypothetical protein
METEFGTAIINNKGYFHIISTEEGNQFKKLHRLIYESEHGPIPEGHVIHHKDNNKLNNRLDNLEMMPTYEHNVLHKSGENHPRYGKKCSAETLYKMSVAKNTTGYFRVYKKKDKNAKNGFYYAYQYYEKKQRKILLGNTLETLKNKVLKKGLKWCKV